MKVHLSILLLMSALSLSSCSESLSTYEVVKLRGAADSAENAAKETESEVTKIKTINENLERSARTQ